MKVIGLTGGIGSGKSTVSRLLNIMGIPVYVADTESKRLTESSPDIREKLTERFGTELYAEGKLNKALLASLIFGNETDRRYVNSVIHPAVRIDFEQWVLRQARFPVSVIEAAILFESGFADSVDMTVTVAAPEDLRIRRIELREGWSQASIVSRIRSQLTEEERISRSDYVIYNDDRQALIPQIEKLLEKIYNL
ncbi:MAG: dephospho-CoA kinase [Candidatus Azobacteroides sp.]|nr:dephospho-CoA kinase [Candidatus Azobacteroides sp.]